MLLLIGAFTIGLILVAAGLRRLRQLPDLQLPGHHDRGSLTLGGAVTAVLIVAGVSPAGATAAAFAAGALAGATTGVLHTRFRINGLLAGILVMTALYSINLHIMGKSNLPLLSERTFATMAESAGTRLVGAASVTLAGWEVDDARRLACSCVALVIAAIVGSLLYLFSAHEPRNRDAGRRRQRADDPRARRERRRR